MLVMQLVTKSVDSQLYPSRWVSLQRVILLIKKSIIDVAIVMRIAYNLTESRGQR
ncbi:basic protein bp1 [Haloquadratum walsbyi DSM 16790]|uniref:Basic protein bp1 n=1 Tax=Haloquadratum walsbyi (strain DSM 16790 / HBSQ001) TaxID=362976 RepID=K0PUM7_HALWD|nr:basic protein bp1 [Haloquadratum walsbyi DSM 16790]